MISIKYIVIAMFTIVHLNAFTDDVEYPNTVLTKIPLFRISNSDTLNSVSFIQSFGKNYNQSEITLNMYRKPLLITSSSQYLFEYEYVYQNLSLSYIRSIDLSTVLLNIIAGYSWHFGFFNESTWNSSKLHCAANSSFRYVNPSIEKYIVPTLSADLGYERLTGNDHTYDNNYMYLDLTMYLEVLKIKDMPMVFSYKKYFNDYSWTNIGIKYIF